MATEGRRGDEAAGGGSSMQQGCAEEAGGWKEGSWGFVETGEGRGGTEGVKGEQVG